MEGVLHFLYHVKLGKYIMHLPTEIREIIYEKTRKVFMKLTVINTNVLLELF